jgi:hypothetical protein
MRLPLAVAGGDWNFALQALHKVASVLEVDRQDVFAALLGEGFVVVKEKAV